jgi:hypothetical protein
VIEISLSSNSCGNQPSVVDKQYKTDQQNPSSNQPNATKNTRLEKHKTSAKNARKITAISEGKQGRKTASMTPAHRKIEIKLKEIG